MIRVLHVLGGLSLGGAETMVMNLYRAIDRTQVQFDFIIHTTEHQTYYDEIIALGGRIYSFPAFNGANLFLLKRKWSRFFDEHPEYKILHSHVRSYATLYIPIAKKHGLMTVIHSHSTSNGRGVASIVKRVMQYPLRYQADFLFSCSKEAGEWLFGKKAMESDRHFVIKNAIDANQYRFDLNVRNEYRKLLNLEQRHVYVHVGRFHVAKNHEFLLRVFKRIHAVDEDAVLMLVGDGELRSRIEEYVSLLGICDSVVLLGNRKDIPKLLQAADVFLFPSLWEGLGIAVVEAEAAGIPCICSNQVPKIVQAVPQCEFLPLDESVWLEEALIKSHTEDRHDNYDKIVEAGYDICETVAWLNKFYKKWENE